MLTQSLWKRIFSIFLVSLMIFSLVPSSIFAAEDGSEERIEYIPEEEICVPEIEATNEELVEDYINQAFGLIPTPGEAKRSIRPALANLNDTELAIYEQLKTMITETANGELPSTVFEIPVDSVLSQTSWTAEELGVEAIIENGKIAQDAVNAAYAKLDYTMRKILDALLSECPYELYWYDKTEGVSYQNPGISATSTFITMAGNIEFSFAVAQEYAAGTYMVDTSLAETVQTAVSNAQSIVSSYAGSSDYEILAGYKTEICQMVDYNHEAAEDDSTPYGNPWQLVWVFDGVDSTKVVCEGYSKAFQYLCDQSAFVSKITCYSVTGTMDGGTGAGPHMWNIITMGDHRNYLVDVTNCDDGSIGAPDLLFLSGTANGSGSQYVFDCSNGQSVTYVYDPSLSGDYLAIAESNYDPEWQPPVFDTLEGTRSSKPDQRKYVEILSWTGLTDQTSINNMTADQMGNFFGSYYYYDKAPSSTFTLAWEDLEQGLKKILNETSVTEKEEDLKSFFQYDPVQESAVVTVPEFPAASESELIKTEDAGFEYGTGTFFFADRYRNGEKTDTVRIGVISAEEMNLVEIVKLDERAVVVNTKYWWPFQEKIDGLPTVMYTGSSFVAEANFCYEDGSTFTGELVQPGEIIVESPDLLGGGWITGSGNYRINAFQPGKTKVTMKFMIFPSNNRTSFFGEATAEFEITILPQTMKVDVDELNMFIGDTYQLKVTGLEEAGDSLTDHSFFAGYNGDRDIIDQNGVITAKDLDSAQVYAYIISEKGQYAYILLRFFELVLSSEEAVYNGKPFTPGIEKFRGMIFSSYMGGIIDYAESDYTVRYEDNVNAGTGRMLIDLNDYRNNSNGPIRLVKEFTIRPANISSATVSSIGSMTYTGKALTPQVTVKSGSTTLKSCTDYTVSYKNNTNIGTATVTITGKGNYTGTKTVTFKITAPPEPQEPEKPEPVSISTAAVTAIASQTYTGKALTPAVTVKVGTATLKSGTDYSVSYSNNTNVGTATVTITGKGNYTGTKTATFSINAASISNAAVAAIAAQTYTGSALTPAVTVKVGTATLKSGTDYTVSYSNNINVGTATVTITGKGNYTGKRTATFTIRAKSISSATVSGLKTLTYNGKARKPAPTVKDGTKTLVSGTDYTVSYKDNKNAGTATVTITGKGNYTGTKTATFTIQPKSIEGVTIKGIKTLTYTGKKLKQTTLKVTDGTTKLKYKTDFKLKYKNSKATGKATIIFIGINNYTGKVTKYFNIRPAQTKIASAKNSAAGTVTLKWAIAKSGTGYEVQYATKSSFKGAKTIDIPKRKTKTTKIKDLKKGKTYYIRVRTYVKIDGKKVYGDWSEKTKVKVTK